MDCPEDSARLLISEVLLSLNYLAEEDAQRFYAAYLFSAEAHETQFRSSGEPYIYHPLAVAHILGQMHLDHEALCAALLHDVVEDTPITPATIEQRFGKRIRHIVEGVSKLSHIHFSTKSEAKAENFTKLLTASLEDARVILVKFADRLHNLRTLGCLNPAKRRRIALETLELYTPLAGRLGLRQLRLELEDLAFAHLYPLRRRLLLSGQANLRQHQKEQIQQIEHCLLQGFKQAGIEVKINRYDQPLWQLLNMRRHRLGTKRPANTTPPARFKTLLATLHFRIQTLTQDDCYRALGVIHNLYKPLPQRFKDYIAVPKTNGYQSLHTALYGPHNALLKIQVCTQSMQLRADYGMATYWQEHPGALPEQKIMLNDWFKPLLELHQAANNSAEFLEYFKDDLFLEEIFVFTPKGKIIRLPAGATPIDFAYAVHTDIGNTCVSALIDQQAAPLSTPLMSGQIVAITTSAQAYPQANWLKSAVTSRARINVQRYLKHADWQQSAKLGQALLAKELLAFNLDLDALPQAQINGWLRNIHVADLETLQNEIALGHRPALLDALALSQSVTQAQPAPAPTHPPLAISSDTNPYLQFATCCLPLPPELILGVPCPPNGIVLHRHDCQTLAQSGATPKDYQAVTWESAPGSSFVSSLHLYAEDRPGTLAAVTHVIAQADANITNIDFPHRDGHYTMLEFVLKVRDVAHITVILRKLAQLPGIVQVARGKPKHLG